MKIIEKQILYETKGLPQNILNEILDFIQFVKEKNLKKAVKTKHIDNINLELSFMDKNEMEHLEGEFLDYKELYPHEK